MTASDYYEQGVAHLDSNQYAEAIEALRQCLALEADFPNAHRKLRHTFATSKHYKTILPMCGLGIAWV